MGKEVICSVCGKSKIVYNSKRNFFVCCHTRQPILSNSTQTAEEMHTLSERASKKEKSNVSDERDVAVASPVIQEEIKPETLEIEEEKPQELEINGTDEEEEVNLCSRCHRAGKRGIINKETKLCELCGENYEGYL